MTTDTHDSERTPDPVLERALDRLAAADRDAAPGSLETAVFRASRRGLRCADARPTVLARIGWGLGMRLAAAVVLLAGTVGILSIVSRQPAPDASQQTVIAAAAFESWLALDDLFEDGFGVRIGVIANDADRLALPEPITADEWQDLEDSL